ncbi:MAG TPA: hypothetical protein VGQ37_02210 [Vicinamibacterales bacterium]|jgi:hypothetical protein|nr:hypothetical protein [Vicinamibacterales bacterium]
MPAEIVLRRLYWVGPATVGAAVAAVMAVQEASLLLLDDLPKFSGRILRSNEPAFAAALFVGCAVLIFPIVVDAAKNPLRTFRRLALGVLLVSCIPNSIAAFSRDAGIEWGMLALMVMHVVAWAVTVAMLTRLTLKRTTTA